MWFKKSYKYSTRNGLKYPQTYQYSKFEGMDFLKYYTASRYAIINNLKKSIHTNFLFGSLAELCNFIKRKDLNFEEKEIFSKMIGLTGEKINGKNWFKSLNGKDNFNTSEIMLNILIFLMRGCNSTTKGYICLWLSKYLKKYEVSKKLYYEYDSDFKKNDGDYENFTNYLLLSINLLSFFKKTKNLKFLNTSLKLDDMLCSNYNKLNSTLDRIILLMALEYELELVRDLYTRKGIKI